MDIIYAIILPIYLECYIFKNKMLSKIKGLFSIQIVQVNPAVSSCAY